MNAITVSVDYADLLAITLPRNRRHFERMMVVTSPSDQQSADVAREHGCEVHVTDAFYRGRALFNKWLALEEGLDILGREGWLTIIDADIVLPESLSWPTLRIGDLYGPRRRMLADINAPIPPHSQWHQVPLYRSTEFAGWMQTFHASDPVLGPAPWHQTCWTHAGCADTFFQEKWPAQRKRRLPFEVLHLGENGTNWCGRATPFRDGSKPLHADDRRKTLAEFMEQRRRTRTLNAERLLHVEPHGDGQRCEQDNKSDQHPQQDPVEQCCCD